MSEYTRAYPRWLPYLDLACAFAAGGLCYASPGWRPLLLALIPWAIRLALMRRPTRRTPLDLPLALFLLTALAGVWAAFDREAAWARFWLIAGGVLIFYALANAEAAGEGRVWFLALFGAGAAVLFVLTNDWTASGKIGFLTRLGQALQAPLPRLPGPVANDNIVGAILAMLLPFAGLAALQAGRELMGVPRHRPLRVALALGLGLALLVLVAFGLVMTASRGAWVAVVGALLLAVLWHVTGRLSRGTSSPAKRGRILLSGLGLVLVAGALVAAARPTAITALINALPGPSPVGARTDLWRDGLLLVADYPFTGLGHDGFMMAYSSYVMLLHVGFIPHAHNLYLDVAIEQGLPGLFLLLVLVALFVRAFWREQTRPEASGRRRQMAAAVLSLVAILVHGLVDDPLYTSRAVLFFFIPLAFASSPPAEDDEPAPRLPPLAVAAGLIVLVALAVVWRGPLVSPVASNVAAVRQTRAELSVYSWPEWPVQDEVRRHVDLGPAIALYERALVLNPGNPSANRRLGQIELSLGQYEAALRHLQAAYAVEGWSNATRQLLGEAYLANGRLEEGQALWSRVRNEQKQLTLRPWWYEHIGDKQRAEWMRQAAESQKGGG